MVLLTSPTQQNAEGRITLMNIAFFIGVWGVSKVLGSMKEINVFLYGEVPQHPPCFSFSHVQLFQTDLITVNTVSFMT